ncbi:hypothetical protein F4604DRAFT_1682340 [Suillus subluteus]|nr:hypothetical protein F4604DRAFT_1682340 [Suillus subluteus]
MPTPIDQQDTHNCRWQDLSEDCSPPIIVTSSATQEDPYDCGWDEPTNIKAVPNGADEVDPYDCGWEDWRDDSLVVTTDDGSVVTADDGSVVTTDDSSTASEDHYDCGWGDLWYTLHGTSVIDLTSSSPSDLNTPIPTLIMASPTYHIHQTVNHKYPSQATVHS